MAIPEDLRDFKALVDIIARLRSPEGCPWDRKQTHASVRECLLEECYEVLEAIDGGDTARLREELGDLLMQVVFHARMAEEAGEFDLEDVVEGIASKLVRRHPHVFGSVEIDSAEDVLLNWEHIKKGERHQEASMLDNVPRKMPSLAYSQEVQARVARVGFDWDDDAGVIDKLAEEVTELAQAQGQEECEDEFGDILFTLANIARRMNIDLESALRGANNKFRGRFAHMERLCRERGLDFAKMTFDDKNALWEEAKQQTG